MVEATGELVDTGHSEQVNLPPGSSITYGGTRYELLQFHFHAPSEHTIDGKHAPMEAHFVHKSADGKLAVVESPEQGTTASAFAPVLTALPSAGRRRVSRWICRRSSRSPPATSPTRGRATPPCSEEVRWIVMLDEDAVSKPEVASFQAKYAKNARPVQPLKGRTVAIALTRQLWRGQLRPAAR